LPSSGLHSNGYSLARRIIADSGWALDREVPEFGRSLGEGVLTPTRVYAGPLLALIRDLPGALRSIPPVPGAGLSANVARILPQGTVGVMRRSSWTVPGGFGVLGDLGGVPLLDRERTWNQGVGMVLSVAADRADEVLSAYPGSWTLGEVLTDDGAHRDSGAYVQGAKGVDAGSAILID